MHRVELKVGKNSTYFFSLKVPNAPCGVESLVKPFFFHKLITLVPNAPCGVERSHLPPIQLSASLVPNAPCGVERIFN